MSFSGGGLSPNPHGAGPSQFTFPLSSASSPSSPSYTSEANHRKHRTRSCDPCSTSKMRCDDYFPPKSCKTCEIRGKTCVPKPGPDMRTKEGKALAARAGAVELAIGGQQQTHSSGSRKARRSNASRTSNGGVSTPLSAHYTSSGLLPTSSLPPTVPASPADLPSLYSTPSSSPAPLGQFPSQLPPTGPGTALLDASTQLRLSAQDLQVRCKEAKQWIRFISKKTTAIQQQLSTQGLNADMLDDATRSLENYAQLQKAMEESLRQLDATLNLFRLASPYHAFPLPSVANTTTREGLGIDIDPISNTMAPSDTQAGNQHRAHGMAPSQPSFSPGAFDLQRPAHGSTMDWQPYPGADHQSSQVHNFDQPHDVWIPDTLLRLSNPPRRRTHAKFNSSPAAMTISIQPEAGRRRTIPSPGPLSAPAGGYLAMLHDGSLSGSGEELPAQSDGLEAGAGFGMTGWSLGYSNHPQEYSVFQGPSLGVFRANSMTGPDNSSMWNDEDNSLPVLPIDLRPATP